jgi:hypothetical protein
MKTKFTLLTILICTILFVGCSGEKDVVETREERVAKLLTGVGNKVWKLREVHVNQVQQNLTDYQKSFTKTYTADPANADPLNQKKGTFLNSDGNTGTWKISDTGYKLEEIFINNPAGPVGVTYSINAITEVKLDIQYLLNMTLVREVYYAN